jgi:NitT/TauT family transport system ATP-binding protein
MCIAGLTSSTEGRIFLRGSEIEGTSRGMIVIFQDYARSLFPWRTVLKNVHFGLEKKAGLSRQEKDEIAREALNSVGLNGFENQYPWELSGGMQQRVALARGIAHRPDIMLMDEPFASVDAQTRAELEDTLLSVWRTFSQTILFVTHDIEEAIYLSRRVLVLSRRPAQILEQISIDLDHPRDQLSTREHAGFVKYRHQIYEMIKGKSRGSG